MQAGARGRGLMGVCRALAHSQTLPFPAFDVSGGASVDRAAPGGCGWATSGWDARRHLHGSSPKLGDEDRIRRTRNAESFGASSGRDDNEAAGWSYEEACTIPNLISLSRALSAPVLGYCIVTEAWPIAIGGTLVAGFSDWLDGYLAKRMKSQESSLGSYLDPLADKVLVTCLTIATGYKGLIDPVVCGVIIGRDVVLLGGEFPPSRPPWLPLDPSLTHSLSLSLSLVCFRGLHSQGARPQLAVEELAGVFSRDQALRGLERRPGRPKRQANLPQQGQHPLSDRTGGGSHGARGLARISVPGSCSRFGIPHRRNNGGFRCDLRSDVLQRADADVTCAVAGKTEKLCERREMSIIGVTNSR